MKKFLASLLIGASALSASALTPGIFDHLGVGVGVGTDGISVEAATPITRWVSMRAGVHFMPNIKFNTDVDAYYDHPATGQYIEESIDVDCGLGRTQGSVIFNVYPFPVGSFFVAAGAYFGGDKLLKIKGHSDAMEDYGGSIEVGDYNLPIDKNGNVRGGLKVSGFRPYLGIGWGRAIPKRLLNFNVELGAQFQGKPKVYSETGALEVIESDETDNDFKDVIKYLKVYPTLTFRLTGKIF